MTKPSLIDRIRVGVYLTHLSVSRHGTSHFWSCISWWHEETHYTIPRRELEKTIVDLFSDSSESKNFLTFNNTGSVTINGSLQKDSAGCWSWNGINVVSLKRPGWIQKAAITCLLGAEWIDKEKPLLAGEYARWQEFLSE